eukprot:10173065-Alexandrium_andersonii.AAC.1
MACAAVELLAATGLRIFCWPGWLVGRGLASGWCAATGCEGSAATGRESACFPSQEAPECAPAVAVSTSGAEDC